jgi:hypothetical protein
MMHRNLSCFGEMTDLLLKVMSTSEDHELQVHFSSLKERILNLIQSDRVRMRGSTLDGILTCFSIIVSSIIE